MEKEKPKTKKKPIQIGDEIRVKLECNKHYAKGKVIDTDDKGVFVQGKLFPDDPESDWITYVKRRYKNETKSAEQANSEGKNEPGGV